MMRIKQRLNNNVVLVDDDAKRPMIVMGKGVGYKAYPGNEIDESLVERTFVLKSVDQVATLIDEIPAEYTLLSDDILQLAEKELHTEFGVGMLVSLADHIFSAVERHKQNIQIATPLHWDIKLLYPAEVKIGEQAVAKINELADIQLDETEATTIAMHFISSGNNYESVQQAMNFTKIISEIIAIIQYHFQFKIDQNSISFSRLVSHLQYFLIRQVKGIKMMNMSEEMIKIVIQQYQDAFQCAEKITALLYKNYQVKPSLEEEIYLTMHIERVLQSREISS